MQPPKGLLAGQRGHLIGEVEDPCSGRTCAPCVADLAVLEELFAITSAAPSVGLAEQFWVTYPALYNIIFKFIQVALCFNLESDWSSLCRC